ncbi:F-actin-capping protein subunit beta [Orbilia oligospora]|nr:F-actin-capping protein subunit beta [Orbilia oligospora]
MKMHLQLWRWGLRSSTTKAIVVILMFLVFFHNLPLRDFGRFTYTTALIAPKHPIDRLIYEQRLRYQDLVKRQSKNPEEAIANYKLRYNRDPPTGFADWVRYALQQNSIIIDDFDTIEKVLHPFRQLDSKQLESRINSARGTGSRLQTISIKNGNSSVSPEGVPILNSLKPVLENLPDMTFLLNELDEPRVLGSQPDKDDIIFQDYGRQPSWTRLTTSCQNISEQQQPHFLESITTSLDLCRNPAYQDQYGMFTSPCTFIATKSLVPIFSAARVSTMHDVLIPGHDYHVESFLSKNDVDFRNFSSKENKLYWRGSNTGTYASSQMKWETNHRVRFMLKARNLTNADLFDVGMTAYIQCDWDVCQAMEQAFGRPPRADKNGSFRYKFVMDLDGNGYSGRFYRLLQSNSVVFKQKLVEQWHDDRLFPWVHYVPVTIGMDEIEDLIRFFSVQDRQAEEIAAESTSWVRAALRPIDMMIYEYRLLLEYASLFEES